MDAILEYDSRPERNRRIFLPFNSLDYLIRSRTHQKANNDNEEENKKQQKRKRKKKKKKESIVTIVLSEGERFFSFQDVLCTSAFLRRTSRTAAACRVRSADEHVRDLSGMQARKIDKSSDFSLSRSRKCLALAFKVFSTKMRRMNWLCFFFFLLSFLRV